MAGRARLWSDQTRGYREKATGLAGSLCAGPLGQNGHSLPDQAKAKLAGWAH